MSMSILLSATLVSRKLHSRSSTNFLCVLTVVMAQSSSGGVVIHNELLFSG